MKFNGKCKVCGSIDGMVTTHGNMCRNLNCYAYMVPIPENASETKIAKILRKSVKARVKARRRLRDGERKINSRNVT